jgi:hypothetical protein
MGPGHEGSSAFLPVGDEADLVDALVEAIEDGEAGLTGDAENGIYALGNQGLDQGVPGEPGRALGH